jgi:hypothetical protein
MKALKDIESYQSIVAHGFWKWMSGSEIVTESSLPRCCLMLVAGIALD